MGQGENSWTPYIRAKVAGVKTGLSDQEKVGQRILISLAGLVYQIHPILGRPPTGADDD
jgi:hypothetical protein